MDPVCFVAVVSALLRQAEVFSRDTAIRISLTCSNTLLEYRPTGGYAATRFNPKHVLAAGALIWSMFTLATPAMAGENTASGAMVYARL